MEFYCSDPYEADHASVKLGRLCYTCGKRMLLPAETLADLQKEVAAFQRQLDYMMQIIKDVTEEAATETPVAQNKNQSS